VSDSALDELRTALSALRRDAVLAARAAADMVEEIDPSFPNWLRSREAGPPPGVSDELLAALDRLDAIVSLQKGIGQITEDLEVRTLRRRNHQP
jgi:hypothetical protein